MEEENEAILLAMLIGAVILGIGLAMFFNQPYTGYGAVVLAIGLMTMSLILTMRAEEITHLKLYPTLARSENMHKISVKTPSPIEPAQEVLEVEETQQVQEAPEIQEHREAQEPPQEIEATQPAQQVEEREETWQTQETLVTEEIQQPYQEIEATTAQEPQETSFAEPEPEQESSIEPISPSSEQSKESEESQEDTATVVTTN